MYTIDIETDPIQHGAPLLPRPVGIALRSPTGHRHYYAWGHPTNNNCSLPTAKRIVANLWDKELLTHNGLGFDIPVLQHWFGMPPRDPLLTHDTLFMAFLVDPHAEQLGLKPLAEKWLGIAPEALDSVADWILANTECRSRKQAGAYISQAPGDLVGRYAEDDVRMTYELFCYLWPRVQCMLPAYNRERLLSPELVDMQIRGVRIDRERLSADAERLSSELIVLEKNILSALDATGLNLDSDAELVDTLQARGFSGFLRTEKGALSASRDSLDVALAGAPDLRAMLQRRANISTLLRTFMGPWLEQSAATGRIYPSYNQVRNPDGYGTRTGRLSSSNPNLQNVPKAFKDQPDLPIMRSYILPEEGDEWTCADFKSQEPRIAAHFEDRALLQAYKDDPELDVYMFVAELAGVERQQAKTIFLGLVYGMGAAKLGEQLGISPAIATALRDKVRAAVPGLNELVATCTRRFRQGLSVTTLGGRVYHCEPPKNGMTFEYKATNVLVQGSAADQSKEALVYAAPRLRSLGARVVSFVHDEYSVSHRPEVRDEVYKIIRESAMALPIDVPMLMDIHTGSNWSEAK